jgi:hypothetical protein
LLGPRFLHLFEQHGVGRAGLQGQRAHGASGAGFIMVGRSGSTASRAQRFLPIDA